MSDGPHRSLSMRPGWKRLARRADNSAFDPAQITQDAVRALALDWHHDVPMDLVRAVESVVEGTQPSLFGPAIQELETIRRSAAGHELGQLFIDSVLNEIRAGTLAGEVIVSAAQSALTGWAARCGRQVEEHYYREASPGRALKVRSRIDEGISGADLRTLARNVVDGRSTQGSKKQTGLDEGARR